MPLVENTTRHPSLVEAEEALAGLRDITGFTFGYIRLAKDGGGGHEAVTIFDCATAAGAEHGRRNVHIPAAQARAHAKRLPPQIPIRKEGVRRP